MSKNKRTGAFKNYLIRSIFWTWSRSIMESKYQTFSEKLQEGGFSTRKLHPFGQNSS